MTPLVMERIGDEQTDAFKQLGVGTEPAHHVRELVRPGRNERRAHDRRLLRRRRPPARVPGVLDRPGRRRDDRARAAPRRRSRRARRTSSRGSSSSCATTTTRAAIGESVAAGVERARARVLREPAHPRRCSPRSVAGATGGVADAPVNIVVCADVERGLEATIPSSIFPAVQNLLLAATALGLGSALTTITTGYRAEMQAILGLPEHVRPIALVPIGHPAKPLGPPPPGAVRRAHAPGALRPDSGWVATAAGSAPRAPDTARAARSARSRSPRRKRSIAPRAVRPDDDDVDVQFLGHPAHGSADVADLDPLVDVRRRERGPRCDRARRRPPPSRCSHTASMFREPADADADCRGPWPRRRAPRSRRAAG